MNWVMALALNVSKGLVTDAMILMRQQPQGPELLNTDAMTAALLSQANDSQSGQTLNSCKPGSALDI